MDTKKKKPTMSFSLKPEIEVWLRDKAEREQRKLSVIVQNILDGEMRRELEAVPTNGGGHE